MDITLEAAQRKILAFQFLSVAVRFATMIPTTSSRSTLETCATQMAEAYNSALLLSIRISFNAEDCRVFDFGSSYVEDAFRLACERAVTLRAGEPASGDAPMPKEWEPMWDDPAPPQEPGGSGIAARAVRLHLKRIEGIARDHSEAAPQSILNEPTFC